MKILIVEDEIFSALHLESALEDMGCTVVGIAPDAPSALDMAEAKPDLAVVDLNLRDGFTGPSLARELANRFGTKVFFLTGNPGQAGEPFEGMIGVVSKPWSERDLRDIIQRAHPEGPEPTSG